MNCSITPGSAAHCTNLIGILLADAAIQGFDPSDFLQWHGSVIGLAHSLNDLVVNERQHMGSIVPPQTISVRTVSPRLSLVITVRTVRQPLVSSPQRLA